MHLWTAGAAFARWNIAGPWSVAVRPEFYWDRNGRMTGPEPLLKAVATVLEHKERLGSRTAWLRSECRFDGSTVEVEEFSTVVKSRPAWSG